MPVSLEYLESGLWGLLVGDALGVPYEFHEPEALPPMEEIEMIPPAGFPRSYPHIAPGTWSDDGAQALCLAASLAERGCWAPEDFAARLLRWQREGYMAVGRRVFDIGIQTGAALARLAAGLPPTKSGLSGERNNGNGSLMRCLPLALLGPDNDTELVRAAHEQSQITHAHPRAEACCALYVLWARAEMRGATNPWDEAIAHLRDIYANNPEFRAHARELEIGILPFAAARPRGTGYVVDTLFSARAALEEPDYVRAVRRAVAFGHDTDTTACVTGGLAALRWGLPSIPPHWREQLHGKPWLGQIFSVRGVKDTAAA